ncbi:MAG: hypothetical protein ACYDA5_11965 [Vulcanimicrobiaceae bacterium]
MTETLLLPWFATYTLDVAQTETGVDPTLIVATTLFVAASIFETVPEPLFTTQMWFERSELIFSGPLPTGIVVRITPVAESSTAT